MLAVQARRASKDRQVRAYAQACEYLIVPASPLANDWDVIHTSGRSYRVDLDANTCTCADHTRRAVACKHLVMVRWEAESIAPANPRDVRPVSTPVVDAEAIARARRDRDLLWPAD